MGELTRQYWASYYRGQAWMGRGYGQPRRSITPTTLARCCAYSAWTPIVDLSDGRCLKCAPRDEGE